MNLLIKGGRVVDPSQDLDSKLDVLIEDGSVVETGRNLKVVASRRPGAPADPVPGKPPATGWSLRGEAEIDNWYDDAGVWLALRGRLPDKSIMQYRRA